MGDKTYILWLSRIKKLGTKGKIELLNYFGSGEKIFNATYSDLKKSNLLNDANIKILQSDQKQQVLNSYIDELKELNIYYTTINDDDYPYLLKTINNPPLVLYYIGTLPNKDDVLISIIGTRKPSFYGKNVTNKISRDLAKNNVVIVSGMARGIDTLASLGAITENGKTIAVLGCGVDICYPPENKNIMKKIVENGCVISEFPPKTKPIPAYFPMRNRIISGISLGTLVIEAALKSGTLITVDFALEEGREVFAVPGNITSRQSEGTNSLIKDGATPVTTYKDILNLLQIDNSHIKVDNSNQYVAKEDLTFDENLVYKLITDDAINIEDLMSESSLPIEKLQFVLTMLEIKGAIKKLPGQQFIREFDGGIN